MSPVDGRSRSLGRPADRLLLASRLGDHLHVAHFGQHLRAGGLGGKSGHPSSRLKAPFEVILLSSQYPYAPDVADPVPGRFFDRLGGVVNGGVDVGHGSWCKLMACGLSDESRNA